MEGNRDDDLDPQIAQARPGLLSPQLANQFRQSLVRGVFQAQNGFTRQAVVGAEPNRGLEGKRFLPTGGTTTGDDSERANRGGAARTREKRVREQGRSAQPAKSRPIRFQGSSAERTAAWKEQMNQTAGDFPTRGGQTIRQHVNVRE
jgi:hypothetical protein